MYKMTQLSNLLQVSDEEKSSILKHFNRTEKEFSDDVETLKLWLAKNSHLPQVTDENRIKVCLLNSKMSLERAKKSIEGYFTVRALYADFFTRLLPNTEHFKKGKEYVLSVIMPRLTPNLDRITIYKITDIGGQAEDALLYYIITMMQAEVRVINDCFISNEIIIDLEHYGIKHMLKFTPSINQKLLHIHNSVNLRVKTIHVVNAPPAADKLLAMFKAILPAKIISKIKIYNSFEELHQNIPKEYLPSEYGGTEKSLKILYADWLDLLQRLEPEFQELLSVKATGELKFERSDEEVFGMGSEGSFKKLCID